MKYEVKYIIRARGQNGGPWNKVDEWYAVYGLEMNGNDTQYMGEGLGVENWG